MARKLESAVIPAPPPQRASSSPGQTPHLWDNLSDVEEEDNAELTPPVVSESRVSEALEYYWTSPRILASADPYDFWRKNSHEFPEVFAIAKVTFSCPSGSA